MIKNLSCISLLILIISYQATAQNTDTVHSQNKLPDAFTVNFCDILESPSKFENKMIRVRALYETDFEKAVITSPRCSTPMPAVWVNFDQQWESRTPRRVHRGLASLKWRAPADVVFIGIFKSGHFGHMDMYPYLLEVYKVEAFQARSNFQPMPVNGD